MFVVRTVLVFSWRRLSDGHCSQSLNHSLGKLKISPTEKISWHLLFEKIALFQELPHVAEIYLPSVWTLKIFHLNWYTTEIETDFPCVGFPQASIFERVLAKKLLGFLWSQRETAPGLPLSPEISFWGWAPGWCHPVRSGGTSGWGRWVGRKGWRYLPGSIPEVLLKGIPSFKWPLE